MDIKQNKEWLEERKKGLGGSDSPVVLGVSPFKTKKELWMEKRGLIEEPEPTPAMKRGRVLEPVVAELYKETTGRKLRRKNQIIQHKKHPFILANLDREIVGSGNGYGGPGVLEIKCPGLKVFSQCKREGLPDYYTIQLQHYLEVTGRNWGSFVVFNAERWELLWFDVKRDNELIDYIIEADLGFWKLVEEGKAPEEEQQPQIDLPKTEPSEIVKIETDQWAYAVQRLKEAQELRKEAEALEEEAKKHIQEIMEFYNAQVVEGAGARVYWKWQNGRELLDSKEIKMELPDIWEKYKKVSKPFRVFKPYFLKETINE